MDKSSRLPATQKGIGMALLRLIQVLVLLPASTLASIIQKSSFSPTNLTLPNSTAIAAAPLSRPQIVPLRGHPDPYFLDIPNTDLVVEFYAYESARGSHSILSCYSAALKEAREHQTPAGKHSPLSTRTRGWMSDDQRTYLYLHPREDMTWGMMPALLLSLYRFCSSYDPSGTCPGFFFTVRDDEARERIGFGRFVAV